MIITIALLCFAAVFEIGFIDAFRIDYTYIESTRSYYKYHQKEASWTDAKSICESEGALLFHPENEPEIAQVLGALGVGDNGGLLLLSGISDLGKHRVYETVDGRPISQVYRTWSAGEPDSCADNICCCGRLSVDTHKLYIDRCGSERRYICKHNERMEEVVTTAIGEVKRTIAAANDRQLTILERLLEAAVNQTAALERLTANQVAAEDRQTEAMLRLGANQTATLERQALAMEKLANLLEGDNQLDERSNQ